MEAEIIKAVAGTTGWALGWVLLCATAYKLGPAFGEAVKARAATWRADQGSKAIDNLNGKLQAALGQAVEPLIQAAVDRSLDELPENMSERLASKIKILGLHGANNALQVLELKAGSRIDAIDGRLEEQNARLGRVEDAVGEVSQGVARIEGRLERGRRS